ncbi:MAG: uroporphyrinogen-III C-methyltransferase [Proteobacteria bacterium]|nr:uroporphyrinogen-III C-methyltransferase [Pseudomonadota bacterium]
MKTGKVYLIGAGPGDPGLITIKGLSCLRKADVVVYDYLANEEFLSSVPPGVERIYVGKKGGDHTLSQEEINSLIAEKARKGKIVARLKGGDPFIFGRGGEEAQELAREGIPFEVVPGVTSAIAVPAYAGIPLTHRDFTSTVAFITGHEDPTKEESRISWDKIATGAGTLVFLMGVGNLPLIAAELMKNGRDPETPVALIRWGTLPGQETVTGKLSTIGKIAQSEGIKPPVIILVGEVVKLREQLNWFERLPLFGKKILVTRSREQASDLSDRLRELGAIPIEFPTIEVIPPENWGDMDHCASQMMEYDWIIFTSVNGVKFFLDRVFTLGLDIRDLKGPRICAIGPKTAEALRALKLKVDFVPSEYRAESIFEGLRKESLKGKKVLIPRAKVARDILPEELRRAGALVDVVEVYRTIRPEGQVEKVYELLAKRAISALTFTSSSTVSNFVEMVGRKDAQELTAGIPIASIGPITAEKAKSLGMETTIMPTEYTIPTLVESLVKYFTAEDEKSVKTKGKLNSKNLNTAK